MPRSNRFLIACTSFRESPATLAIFRGTSPARIPVGNTAHCVLSATVHRLERRDSPPPLLTVRAGKRDSEYCSKCWSLTEQENRLLSCLPNRFRESDPILAPTTALRKKISLEQPDPRLLTDGSHSAPLEIRSYRF